MSDHPAMPPLTFGVLVFGGAALVVALSVGVSRSWQREYIETDMSVETTAWERVGPHTHLRGQVKNEGRQTITYWRVRARYMGASGAVLDTAYANSTETLRPGEAKGFEITHPADPRAVKTDVTLENIHMQVRPW